MEVLSTVCFPSNTAMEDYVLVIFNSLVVVLAAAAFWFGKRLRGACIHIYMSNSLRLQPIYLSSAKLQQGLLTLVNEEFLEYDAEVRWSGQVRQDTKQQFQRPDRLIKLLRCCSWRVKDTARRAV